MYYFLSSRNNAKTIKIGITWGTQKVSERSPIICIILYRLYKTNRSNVRWNQPLGTALLCTIWYHLYNLKNVENTNWHQWMSATLLNVALHGCFSRFLNCTNGTESRNSSYMLLSNISIGLRRPGLWVKFQINEIFV